MINWSEEEIRRDLTARAREAWGPERLEALRRQIDDTASWISQVLTHPLPLDGEEPDFLVAPAATEDVG